ncbi:glycoside hydrolase family 88 protein [Anaeromicropila populeti]|uniref:Unsaturated chondroitin disaccharide hydrolase n=1 Tax=Anaeromicropila populeti TaxID=37658 RepID=A0A1I6KBC6_9FIRM|nr:glycoside hydrolase family 88 protein [Anaeromicropila populeti]SFR88444.1 unsaturated chondroitin disaccharide hydrolase [Anaeromicropila populeti]
MDEIKWAKLVAEKIIKKVSIVAERNKDKIPYTTVEGKFDDQSITNICWWTNGFWGGIMWQLYHASKNELFRQIAEENEEKLDQNLMEPQGLDHDNGFKWLPTAVANYRLTGSQKSRNRGLLAANHLAGRFNLSGTFIRAWNDYGDSNNAGLAIIDCMMNLPLLYWASEEINDPRFRQIAVMHADMAEKFFIKQDGSAHHIVEFNPETGEFVKTYGGQGFCEGSSWTRGQAWAIYGFALSYLHTKKQSYLDTAKKVADYFISHIPVSGFVPVDFFQPEDCNLEDSTASAIAACGLLELQKMVSLEEKKIYYKTAIQMLQTLEKSRCNWDEDSDNILERCTAAFHDKTHEFSIIYGDYFFIEAIWKLNGQEIFIW